MVKGNLKSHCKNGHEFTEDNIYYCKRDRGRGIEIRRVCRICQLKKAKEYNDNLTTEKRIYRNSVTKKWRDSNKDIVKSSKLKSSFNISIEEYNDILINQGGKCILCGNIPSNKYFPVDHDHITGKIRGILCVQCNTTLGKVERIGIDNIINYLKN